MTNNSVRFVAVIGTIALLPAGLYLLLFAGLLSAGTDTHTPSDEDRVLLLGVLIGLGGVLTTLAGLIGGSRMTTLVGVTGQLGCAAILLILWLGTGFPIDEDIPAIGPGLVALGAIDGLAVWAACAPSGARRG